MKTTTNANLHQKLDTTHIHPLLKLKDRILTWKNAKGAWKNKKNNIDNDLKNIREEWDRK